MSCWKAKLAKTVLMTGVLLAIVPAHADDSQQEQKAGRGVSRLVLTWAYEDGADAEKVTLRCHPVVWGTHPNRVNACDALERVDGYFEQLPSTNDPCTKEYRPVTVTASGYWVQHPVGYSETFGNLCAAKTETDNVFDF
jgi:hypothetical protein